jgi:PIN domain nuclease of toxin-antitoxin system
MIMLDTCILLFDSLTPERLSKAAIDILNKEENANQLFCSDISLWEIAMLDQKKRIHLPMDYLVFIENLLNARNIEVLPITPKIAHLSVSLPLEQADPADRIIAATTLYHHAQLVTADRKLLNNSEVPTIF